MITIYPHSIAALTLTPLRAVWAARERVAAAWATWWEAVDAAADVFLAEDDEQDGAA